MEFKAYFHNLHISAKKLRSVLPEIKKLQPLEALDYLNYSPKKSAHVFYKAIKSVIDNAKYTLKADPGMLKFKLLTVEQGQVLKRYQAGGRGTVKPYKKRFSHIKIILESAEVKKQETKKTASKEEKSLQVGSADKRVKKPAVKKAVKTSK